MSIELKQAAEQALNALDEATTYTGSPWWSPSMTDECIAAASALRSALAQQPATAIACGIPGMAKTTCPYCEQGFAFEHEQPATGDDFDLICNAIDKADTITMEGDYMLDSDDCIAVVRVMQVLLSVRAAMLAAK